MNRKIKLSLAVFALVAILAVSTAYGLIQVSKTFHTNGIVITGNIAVKFANGTEVTSITWAPLAVGDSTTENFYVTNTGTVPLTLVVNFDGITPAAAAGKIVGTVNGQSSYTQVLAPQQTSNAIPATISLNAEGGFTSYSTDLIFTGTQTQ